MKEVNLHNPAFGKDKKDRDSSVEIIVSELTIIREQVCLLCLRLKKNKNPVLVSCMMYTEKLLAGIILKELHLH